MLFSSFFHFDLRLIFQHLKLDDGVFFDAATVSLLFHSSFDANFASDSSIF
jgi:hypothetical protein